MPKYRYTCTSCERGYYIYLGMTEEHIKCVHCGEETIHKVPEMPFIRRENNSKGDRVGDKVKDAIEENRALLEEAKKKARNNNWDPHT